MAHGRSSSFLTSLSLEEQAEREHSQPRTTITAALADRSMAERIAASVDNWQRKLLDLTKRNRALNFRMNKVSTVAIVDEHPAEVFRQLYIRGEAMRSFPSNSLAGQRGLALPGPSDRRRPNH